MKEQITALLNHLQEHFEKELSDFAIAVYFESLQKYSLQQIEFACKRAIQNCSVSRGFFPSAKLLGEFAESAPGSMFLNYHEAPAIEGYEAKLSPEEMKNIRAIFRMALRVFNLEGGKDQARLKELKGWDLSALQERQNELLSLRRADQIVKGF